MRAAESRQRQLAAQQLLNEGKLTMSVASSVQQPLSQQPQSMSCVTNGNSNVTVAPSVPSPANNQNTVIINASTNMPSETRPPSRPPSQQAPISNSHLTQDLASNFK